MDEEKIEELKSRGLLIIPEEIDSYLKNFENIKKSAFPSQSYWKDRRVLITGISGFAGSHLAEKLLSLGAEITGLVRRHSVPEYRNISHITKRVNLVEGNLLDFNSVNDVIKQQEPEVIFHLGAQSFVPTSFRCPIETYMVNVIGTANMAEAVRQAKHNIEAFQIACSSEEYGLVHPEEVPIKETNPLRPQSPYGVSKVAAEKIGETHYRAYGIPSVITRTFNHTGPRRGVQFVTSVVTRQIAMIRKGITDTLFIGNTAPIRDFTDVRDIVTGYLLAAEKAKRGEPYNLGHGKGITISDLIKLAAMVGEVKDYKVEIDKRRFRPAEVEILICDYSKANKETGYQPTIPLTKALLDNINYFEDNPHLLFIERH